MRSDAIQRREQPAEHVIKAAEASGGFDRLEIPGFGHNAHDVRIAARVGADRAEFVFREVVALRASSHPGLHSGQRIGERRDSRVGVSHEMVDHTFRGASTNSGKGHEGADEPFDT
jgi:hypothetical protein